MASASASQLAVQLQTRNFSETMLGCKNGLLISNVCLTVCPHIKQAFCIADCSTRHASAKDAACTICCKQYLAAVTHATDCHFPAHDVVTNLSVIFVQLVEGANLEEEDDVPILLLDLPVLLLRVCKNAISKPYMLDVL